jgi:sirohydrochlorin ferrochelatase
MQAILLSGHGSLRPGSGAAMIRLAARLREGPAAPLAAAGFLNYSRPTLAEAAERLRRCGAASLVVQPYLLVPGYFSRVVLPRAVAALREAMPELPIAQAEPLGAHPALAELLRVRADEAGAGPASALLLAAHGSPDPAANQPVEAVAAMLRVAGAYAAVVPCYLGLNQPDIPTAIAAQVAAGHGHVVVAPYLLQLGGHAAEDLPAIVAAAQQAHPGAHIVGAGHLGYHPLLATVIADRLATYGRARQGVALPEQAFL